jgi:hypothetical protein
LGSILHRLRINIAGWARCALPALQAAFVDLFVDASPLPPDHLMCHSSRCCLTARRDFYRCEYTTYIQKIIAKVVDIPRMHACMQAHIVALIIYQGANMFRKLLMVALTTGLAAKGIQVMMQRAEQRKILQKKHDKKVAVQRWENEGGPAR